MYTPLVPPLWSLRLRPLVLGIDDLPLVDTTGECVKVLLVERPVGVEKWLLISLLTAEAIAPAKRSVVSLSISGTHTNNYCVIMMLYTTLQHRYKYVDVLINTLQYLQVRPCIY